MAFYFSNSFLLVSILLAIFVVPFIDLSYARLTVKVKPTQTNDLINQVCSMAINPKPCFETFKSDPRSATTNLKGLGLISVDLAQALAETTLNSFPTLIKTTNDSC